MLRQAAGTYPSKYLATRARVPGALTANQISTLEELSLAPKPAPPARYSPRPVSVLHIDSERGWRGGQRQVLWLAESLVRSGNQCVIAARPNEPLALRAVERGLRVVACAPRWEFDIFSAVSLAQFVRREGIQIVHAHTAHAASITFLCTRHARLVITRRVDFSVGGDLLSQLKYRYASAIIAISEAVKTAMVASGVDATKIEVIPSGVDLTRSLPKPANDALRLFGIPEGVPLVVMVAALAGHKDPLTFLRAMRSVIDAIPNTRALMIGDGPMRSTVERVIEQLGLGGNVHLAGHRLDAEALLAAADVVALSSNKEGLGTVLIDALWMGKAVAATRAGGIPEIVEDGSCGLLSPVGDSAALGAAITRLLRDSNLSARLGAAGRTRAAAFSIERTAGRTALVYERVNAVRR